MMGYGWGMMGGFGMFLIPLLLIGAIIYIVARSPQRHHDDYDNRYKRDNAIEILNERFAKGEITEEEYKEKKKY